jgi:hypothetical protein
MTSHRLGGSREVVMAEHTPDRYLAGPLHEIERRAAAICRNAEAALLDELPVDGVLLSNLALAGWIGRYAQVIPGGLR